ncbi:MAG: restriction endonuclease subunit S [Acidimicrobiia bacterium]|nr:restriction endonuclease subunit S [Acidimicrobiia bacterium]
MVEPATKRRWTRVAFGDVVRKVSDRVDPETSGLERYVAGEHMDTDNLRISRWGTTGDGYLGPAFHMRFKPGQVLYGSRRTYLRKVAVADFAGITANTTFVLEPEDPNVLLPELLPFIMQTESFHDHSIKQSKGSVNPYINYSDLAWYEFALPPVEEQRRIAEGIAALGTTVETLKAVVDSSTRVALAVVDDSLRATDAVEMRVDQAFEVQIGRQRAPKYATGTQACRYLRAANIKDGRLLLDDVLEMDFTADERRTFRLTTGDVLITEGCGSPEELGATARWSGELSDDVCFQNTLLRLRPRKGVTTAGFAYAWARHAYKSGKFLRVARGSNILHIGSKRLSAMPMKVPQLRAQDDLEEMLVRVEIASSNASQRRSALESARRRILNENLGESSE